MSTSNMESPGGRLRSGCARRTRPITSTPGCSPRKRLSPQKPPATTSLTLISGAYSDKILEGLALLRTSGLLTDIILVAEDKEFPVHKAVLVSSSDYFRAMFTGEMKETKENRVNLQGISCTGLRLVVDFVYSGRLDLKLATLEEVLAASTHLQVSEAVDMCCEFMEKALTIGNCVDVLNMTELYSLTDTREKSRSFILEHFHELSDSDQYEKLTCSQLAALLSEHRLRVTSEYRLFELVLRWINFDPKVRQQWTPQLMSNLRLPLLSGEELVDKVSKVSVMQQNRQCSDLLMEAKDYHIVVSKQPLLQTSRTQVRSSKETLVMCHAENLECYDFETDKHAFLKDAPVPMYCPCICMVDNFMYACGGKYDSNENNEIATARCFRYDPRFDSWFELTSMNEARKDFVMLAMNNKLYAIAGQDENVVISTQEVYDIGKNDWESCAGLGSAVYGHAAAICLGRIFVSGGNKFDGHCAAVTSYDAERDTWADELPLLYARSNHDMVEVGGRLYVLGGNVEDAYGFPVPVTQIEMYDPAIRAWSVLKTSINIREAGACVLNNRIYIVGGINGQHYFSDLVQYFDPEEDSLTQLEKFSNRIYGRACCVLLLPQVVFPE